MLRERIVLRYQDPFDSTNQVGPHRINMIDGRARVDEEEDPVSLDSYDSVVGEIVPPEDILSADGPAEDATATAVPGWLKTLRRLGVKPGIEMTAQIDGECVSRERLVRAASSPFDHGILRFPTENMDWCELEVKLERGDVSHPQGLGAMARICSVNRREKINNGKLDVSNFTRCHCEQVATDPSMKVHMVGKDYRGVLLDFEGLSVVDPVLYGIFKEAVALERLGPVMVRHTGQSLHESEFLLRNSCLGDSSEAPGRLREAANNVWEDRTAKMQYAYGRLAEAKNLNEVRRRVVLLAEELAKNKIAAKEIPTHADGYIEFWLSQGQRFFMFRCLDEQ